MNHLIPTTTKLPADKIPMLKGAIERRVEKLKKCRFGDAEMSLFLMSEIAHLRDLLDFNEKSLTPSP